MSATTYAWLVLLFPLLGSAVIGLGWRWLPGRSAGWIGTGAIALSFINSVAAFADEIVAFFEEVHEMLPGARTTPPEFIQADERTVIVGFEVLGTGASSGAGTRMQIWQVWEMRKGGIPLRVREFRDRAGALEAAGVEEPAEESG